MTKHFRKIVAIAAVVAFIAVPATAMQAGSDGTTSVMPGYYEIRHMGGQLDCRHDVCIVDRDRFGNATI